MRRGLHLLGADATSDGNSASKYAPYIEAAGSAAGAIAKGITEGLKSSSPPPPPPPPPEESNVVWYVAGGAVVLAAIVVLLTRYR